MRKNDKQLLGLLLNGDEASFKVLYNYFYPKLFYFVSEYLPDQDLAEDIVHDTFLALWKNRLNLRPGTDLNAWLYTVAKNNSLKKIRDEKYRKAILQPVALTRPGNSGGLTICLTRSAETIPGISKTYTMLPVWPGQ